MIDGAGDTQRQCLVQNLIVPRRLVVGMQQQMRVPFDETRQERRARQIDRRRVARHSQLRPRTNRFDAVAAHQHGPTIVRLTVDAVPNARGNEQGCAQRRCRDRLWALSV